MGQFDDPNVIHLEGVITKGIGYYAKCLFSWKVNPIHIVFFSIVLPKMIVTEFMLNGSLDHYLKVRLNIVRAVYLLMY